MIGTTEETIYGKIWGFWALAGFQHAAQAWVEADLDLIKSFHASE